MRLEEESDKIEDNKLQESLDWAEAEEKKDLERMKAMMEAKAQDPMSDPANVEWVNKQLEAARQEYGEDFGDDIDMDFTK